MTIGKTYSPEWRDYTDPLTGRRVCQLTNSPTEDYHLYFYNPSITPDGRQVFDVLCRHNSYTFGEDLRCHPHPSFTPDGRQVIFTSNRTGTRDIYLTDWD